MGIGFGYICKKCGAHKNLFYGVGFLGYKEYYMDNNYQELIDLAKRDKIRNNERLMEFIKAKADLKEGFGFDEYICTKCKCIDSKLRFVLTKDDKVYYPKYSCKYCNGSLKQRKLEEDYKIKCDECGSEEFEKTRHMINWD